MISLRIKTFLFLAVSYSITELEGLNTNSNARRHFVQSAIGTTAAAFLPLAAANAAPPFAIMAEELGYFPVYDKQGGVIYVPKRVARESSPQAIDLANHLKKQNVVFYGAYWCPHCARQKELFGREAWKIMAAKNYVECDGRGYGGNPSMCITNNIDGFPTWKKGRLELLSGEVPLSALAAASKYPGSFNEELEQNLPSLLGSSKCQ
jgi:hypothetical protein